MKTLRDRYCIVGVGETEYSRGSGRTTRALAVEAVRRAILDAGLTARDVDGMMDYQSGDSTLANHVAPDLGIRLDFYMDVVGGGSSTEALVGMAMGLIILLFALHTVLNIRMWRGVDELLRRTTLEAATATFFLGQGLLFLWAAAERLSLLPPLTAWDAYAVLMTLYLFVSAVVSARRGLA